MKRIFLKWMFTTLLGLSALVASGASASAQNYWGSSVYYPPQPFYTSYYYGQPVYSGVYAARPYYYGSYYYGAPYYSTYYGSPYYYGGYVGPTYYGAPTVGYYGGSQVSVRRRRIGWR